MNNWGTTDYERHIIELLINTFDQMTERDFPRIP